MFLKTYSFISFEDGGEAGAGEMGAGEMGAGEEGKKKGRTFTQEEVNTFLAKEKRTTKDTQRQLATQLQEAKKSATLSSDEKTELEAQIDKLQKQYMTVEEQTRQASEKTTKAHREELKTLSEERESWKTRYTQSTINSAITQAAVTHEAIEVGQISAMLLPAAKLTEKLGEDGKPTGAFEPRVDFQDLDKDNKPILLDLTVDDAVKRMTELEQYGNLFKGGKSGGLGGSGGTGGISSTPDIAKLAKDPAKYRKMRKEQPDLLYGPKIG